MNDDRDDPYRPPSTEHPGVEPPPTPGEGSIVYGILLAWVIMIVGTLASVGLGMASPVALLGWFLPPLATVVTGVVLIRRGTRRTGKGVLLGLASVVAVIILLVAACFGLLVTQGGLGG